MTSSAWVPIEPVEPRTATRFSLPPSESDDLEQAAEVVRRRQGEQQGVEAVEEATVAREDVAHVLATEIPLDHRLAEVAEGCDDCDHHAEGEGLAHTVERLPADDPDRHRGHDD